MENLWADLNGPVHYVDFGGRGRALVRQRPDWELAVLPDAGHVPLLEDPPGFLAVVEPWLARATTAATIQSARGH